MDGDYLSQGSYQTTAYLRIASLSIALYDLLETAPTTWMYTWEQWNVPRVNVSFALFLVIQLRLLFALSIQDVRDPHVCRKIHKHSHHRPLERWILLFSLHRTLLLSLLYNTLDFQSHTVNRITNHPGSPRSAFNLSRRSRLVGGPLLVLLIAATALEGLTNLYQRTPVLDAQFGNCRGVFQIEHLGAWIYYVVAIIYDLATSTVCMIYLYKYKKASNSFFAKVTRMMLYDGIGYFTALTCVNILNLIIYRASQEIQTAAASLGYSVTWIMSKRLIIHLHEVSMKRRIDDDAAFDAAITSSQYTGSEFGVSHITPSQFKTKAPTSLDLTIPDFDLEDVGATDWMDDGSAHIRVEKTVQVERRPMTIYDLGDDSACSSSSRHAV